MNRRLTKYHQKHRATAVIWICAVGMFALCIPLTAVANSGVILPLLVVLGASAGTAAVWFSPDDQRREDAMTIKALEGRITNLETIYTSLPEIDQSLQLVEKNRR